MRRRRRGRGVKSLSARRCGGAFVVRWRMARPREVLGMVGGSGSIITVLAGRAQEIGGCLFFSGLDVCAGRGRRDRHVCAADVCERRRGGIATRASIDAGPWGGDGRARKATRGETRPRTRTHVSLSPSLPIRPLICLVVSRRGGHSAEESHSAVSPRRRVSPPPPPSPRRFAFLRR